MGNIEMDEGKEREEAIQSGEQIAFGRRRNEQTSSLHTERMIWPVPARTTEKVHSRQENQRGIKGIETNNELANEASFRVKCYQ
jgi:hypothetical protein